MSFGENKNPGEQGSYEWLYERVGKVTCSRFRDVMDFTKKGDPGAKRNAYLWEIVTERLTGQPVQHYENAAMRHGTENETFARAAYEAATGDMVMETGFISHPTIDGVGGSPDGLIDEDSGIEIKCPMISSHHLNCWLEGVPKEHIPQIQGLMWVTGRPKWRFVSFDPRISGKLGLYIADVPRDHAYISALEKGVLEFLDDVELTISTLLSKAAA